MTKHDSMAYLYQRVYEHVQSNTQNNYQTIVIQRWKQGQI